MNEIQGALGLGQLSKLDLVICEQAEKQGGDPGDRLQASGDSIPRDPRSDGDTATFLAFNLPDAARAKKFQKALRKRCGDDLLQGKTCGTTCRTGNISWRRRRRSSTKYPFTDPCYKGSVVYGAGGHPRAEDILGRTLVMPFRSGWRRSVSM